MKKIVIIGLLILAVVSLVVGFFFLNSKPDKLTEKEKEQAVSKILGRKANINPDVKTGNVSYSSKHASFEYPARAKIYKYTDPDAKKNLSFIDRFSFDIDEPRLTLNYSVEKKADPTSSIRDYPAVKLREDKAQGYTMSEISIEGQKGLAFSKRGSGEVKSEKSGFLIEDNLIFTISVSGNNLEDVSDLFKLLISSLSFKN